MNSVWSHTYKNVFLQNTKSIYHHFLFYY